MDYLSALFEFMLRLKALEAIDYEYPNLIFLSSSLVVSFLLILLDKSVHYLKGKSILGLSYTKEKGIIKTVIIWTFAATVMSYFGLILGIFNSTIQSCVIVGFSWLYLFINLVKQYSEPEAQQEI